MNAVTVGAPDTKFTHVSGYCVGDTFVFENHTIPAEDPSTPYYHTWSYQHADSVKPTLFSSEADAKRQFKIPGNYRIFYSSGISESCYNTSVENLTVHGVLADFSYTNPGLCTPSTVSVKAIIRAGNSSGLSYRWRIYPAEEAAIVDSTAINTSILLKKNVCYRIELVVVNTSGCSAVAQKQGICPGVDADLAMPQKACPGKAIQLINRSKNFASKYKWSATPSTGVIFLPSDTSFSPQVVFPAEGVYSIRLISTNLHKACPDTAISGITIISPKALFTASGTEFYCAPVEVTFKNKSINGTTYTWFFGDGSSLITSDSIVVKRYETNNISGYKVKLVALLGNNCTDTFTLPSLIRISGPQPKFIPDKNAACGSLSVSFSDSSSFISSYIMQYGDNSPPESNMMNPHHYLFNDNTKDSIQYIPTLLAIDKANCFAVFKDTITLYRPVTAGFSAVSTLGCAPFAVQFKNESKFASRYYWDLDSDGKIDDSSTSPLWVFKEPGQYAVTLYANSKYCQDVVQKKAYITVHDKPEANFTHTEAKCYKDSFYFTGNELSGVTVTSWSWDFDDVGATSSEKVPGYSFKVPGQHNVKLVVENIYGCQDTFIKQVVSPDSILSQTLQIRYVTIKDNRTLCITWEESKDPDTYGYELYRDDELVYKTTRLTDTIFKEPFPSIPLKPYTYTLRTLNKCKINGNSHGHRSIYAQVVQGGPSFLKLTWNDYTGWGDNGVKYYLIYRKEGKKDFKLYRTVGPHETSMMDSQFCNTFYNYYVRAVKLDETFTSESNITGIQPIYITQDQPLKLYYASVENGDSITVSWSRGMQPNLKHYIIERYRPGYGWQNEYKLSYDTFFFDSDASVDVHAYKYRVYTEDHCGSLSPLSNEGTSILLTSEIKNDRKYLYWTKYSGWPAGVQEYLVQIKDERGRFRTIARRSIQDTFYIEDSLYDAKIGSNCYRIMAIEDAALALQNSSISNVNCVNLIARVYAPSAFTPNNDSLNDVWQLLSVSIYESFNLKIFNRWGQLIYETAEHPAAWNGTISGKAAPAGLYHYELSGMTVERQKFNQRGSFCLLN